jgi:nucleotide-binding universal stress UspA family protein
MYKKIMVPLDGSELAEYVLPHVREFAANSRTESIFLVTVVEPVPIHYEEAVSYSDQAAFIGAREKAEQIEKENRVAAEKYLDGVKNRFKENNAKIKGELLFGQIADKLVDFVDKNEIDLIIIATHGRSGISRWVRGSIADKILHSACAPILMVRSEGCEHKESI